MIIRHASGLAGAASVAGPAIVVDVFRAFTAAAYAFAAGATRIVLAATVSEARELATAISDSVLMGEVNGVRPDGFLLGNSPGEIVANPHLVAGRTVVHRSSAGTRCARAAIDHGGEPLYVASLVVATATAAAVADLPEVTIVTSGLSGHSLAEEDVICGNLISDLLLGARVDTAASGEAAATTDRAKLLRDAPFAHPDDVRLCTAVDRFTFAMLATERDGVVTVATIGAT